MLAVDDDEVVAAALIELQDRRVGTQVEHGAKHRFTGIELLLKQLCRSCGYGSRGIEKFQARDSLARL